MATARTIIRAALTVRLNRLSPGEPEDADLFADCLRALNHIADEWSGSKAFLFREILSAGTVSGVTGTLGTTWANLLPGDEILQATVTYSAGNDVPLAPITMAQYTNIPIKSTAGLPQVYAHDGQSLVYFYPAATGQSVTLRTKQVLSEFADLDTDYTLPKGYTSALTDVLAETLAPVLVDGLPPQIALAAKAARARIAGQSVNPAIPNARPMRFNILVNSN